MPVANATPRIEVALRAYEATVTADKGSYGWFLRFRDVNWRNTASALKNSFNAGELGGSSSFSYQMTGPLREGDTSIVTIGSIWGSVNPTSGHYWAEASPFTFEVWVKTTAATSDDLMTSSNATATQALRLENGVVRWQLKNWGTGTTILNMTRGSGLNDGHWHHIVASYNNPNGKIYIDGVQSGATDTTGSAIGTPSPNPTMRIVGPVGSLAEIAVFASELSSSRVAAHYAAAGWTDVTSDVVLSQPIEAHYGIFSSTPDQFVAETGTLKFALNNSEGNSVATVGYYSPNHASCRTGFARHIPVRYSILHNSIRYYKFVGWLEVIDPLPGSKRERITQCSAVDFMGILSKTNVRLGTSTGQTSDQLLTQLLTAVEATGPNTSPEATSFATGASTFPYGFIGGSDITNALSEAQRITASELGQLFVKGDTTTGGVFTLQTRFTRPSNTTNASTFSNTEAGLEVVTDMADVFNDVQLTCHPRAVTAAASVLYSSDTVPKLDPLQVLNITGSYRDPDQRAQSVAGITMITPVSGTDWVANDSPDGSGTSLTANVTVTVFYGGTAAFFTITNTGTVPCYLTKLQCRGTGLLDYDQKVIQVQDTSNQLTYGVSTLAIDLPYENDTTAVRGLADRLIASWATSGTWEGEVSIAKSVTIYGNTSDTLMAAALGREPGDRIGLTETVTGVSTTSTTGAPTRGFVINGVTLTCEQGTVYSAQWTLTPAEILRANVDYLIVAGGGGGGRSVAAVNRGAGGGGAGQIVIGQYPMYAGMGNVTVTVGGGGAGATVAGNKGASGSTSSAVRSGIDVIAAEGGGGGGTVNTPAGSSGGSGGGAADDNTSASGGSYVSQTPPTFAKSFTYLGHSGGNNAPGGAGGGSGAGGGGAGAAGANGVATGTTNPAGGAGAMFNIGGSTTFARGGDGGAYNGFVVAYDYLICGGGGGGGTNTTGSGILQAGSGGGGGVVTGRATITVGTYAQTIGAGGAIGSNGGTTNSAATGGGHGGAYGVAGASGGSGGGSGGDASGAGGAGTAGQGYVGGSATGQTPGAGGGAGGPAYLSSPGVGLASSISGSMAIYGAGGVEYPGAATGYGAGGSGGQGDGGPSSAGQAGVVIISYPTGTMTATGGTITTVGGNTIHTSTSNGNFVVSAVAGSAAGQAGAPNTGNGGGGGAGGSTANNGGNGGSGIVIFAYPTGALNGSGGTITTAGGKTIHTFTTSGTFTL